MNVMGYNMKEDSVCIELCFGKNIVNGIVNLERF